MNIVLWLLQAGLAFMFVASGAYKLTSAADLTPMFPTVPAIVWQLSGALDVIGAVLLIVPAVLRRKVELTWMGAALLAVETLALAAFYATYSLEMAATNPLPWALVLGVLAAFVAYGRRNLAPLDR